MSDINITYKNSSIATMDASGTKTIETAGKYCEDDITIEYVRPSGGGTVSVPAKAVNFRDYDGTITNSYSKEEFLALSAMPANPSHDGLTAQGWNWSLSDAKAYVTQYGRLEVGQMYITDDGKTRVYIHLEEGRASPMLGVCPDGTVDVDWGDGTAHDTLSGTSTTTVQWTPNHAYAAPGDYVIKLTVTGSMGFYGYNSTNQYSCLLRYTSGGDTRNYVYRNAIQRVEIGSGVTYINDYAFYNCYNLASIIIPNSVTSIGSRAFYYCYGLSSITIPSELSSINTYAFTNCYNLSNVVLNNGISYIGSNAFSSCYTLSSIALSERNTSIGQSQFSGCYTLANITIPYSVTSIGVSAFNNCYGVVEYHLAPTTPPTLGTSAFTGIPADCIIYVPYSADHSVLDDYKEAEYWSVYADRIQEESE